MIVIVLEDKDRQELESRLGPQSYPSREEALAYYEMKDYFKIEGFTTLEEVKIWLEDISNG